MKSREWIEREIITQDEITDQFLSCGRAEADHRAEVCRARANVLRKVLEDSEPKPIKPLEMTAFGHSDLIAKINELIAVENKRIVNS